MPDPVEVLAEHLHDEGRALRVLDALQQAGLRVVPIATDGDVLAATERELTGEPLLGPHQAALVHALTCRLHQGWPMQNTDLQAVRWLAATLGLPAEHLPR